MGEMLKVALVTAASYRLWRLLGFDDVTQPARDVIPAFSKLNDLVTCPWCLGSWCAFLVTWLTHRRTPLAHPVLTGLAAGVGVGWLHGLLEGDDELTVELEDDDTA